MNPLPSSSPPRLLDAGFDLTLRPMRYPQFYEMYPGRHKEHVDVEEIDFR
jgi:ribonucleoside-diphosphate reductase beta chain